MKIGLQFIDPLNFVAQRFLLASIALLPVLILRRRTLPRDSYTWLKLITLSLIIAVSATLTSIGLLYETIGLSSLLTYTQPLFVFCLAIIFLGERITKIKALGLISSFLGVAMLYIGKSFSQTFLLEPFLLLVLGAFLWAVSIVYYKKFLGHVEPAIINIIQFPIGLTFLLLLVFMTGSLSFCRDTLYIFSILYTSILGSALASTIWLFLIREEEAIVISTSSLIVPVIATLLGWLLIGESIGYDFLASFILVLTGLYLVNMPTSGR